MLATVIAKRGEWQNSCNPSPLVPAMPKFLLVIVPAIWIVAIAILSVQNATPVAIKFLGLQSVDLPVGVVLSFFAAGSMVITAGLWWLLSQGRRSR
jgi:uncharacterized integral membrane protein